MRCGLQCQIVPCLRGSSICETTATLTGLYLISRNYTRWGLIVSHLDSRHKPSASTTPTPVRMKSGKSETTELSETICGHLGRGLSRCARSVAVRPRRDDRANMHEIHSAVQPFLQHFANSWNFGFSVSRRPKKLPSIQDQAESSLMLTVSFATGQQWVVLTTGRLRRSMRL